MTQRALLLRDESLAFHEALARIGVQTHFTPVLDFEYMNEPQLRALLERDAAATLIVTSPRAAEAIGRLALRAPVRPGKAFAVGQETARRLRALEFDVTGDQSGDAEALAEYIIEARPTNTLAFLCGNRRRDVLPDRLREARIAFEELTVYHTVLLPPPFARAETPFDWVVLFSPSGFEAALADDGFPWGGRLAAIGRTTADAIAQAGREVGAVAEKPSPESLAIAIADSQ